MSADYPPDFSASPTSPSHVVGIDLGGTTFSVGLVDEHGAISQFREAPTRGNEGPERLLSRLAQAAREVLEKVGAVPAEAVVGIGVPGMVRHSAGICSYAPNLQGWKNLPVAHLLQEELGARAFILNDADAAAFGEARYGAGRGARHTLVLTLGTGIGSGLILGGNLHFGHAERGAEIGHTSISFESQLGSAGNNGTLESLCGRDAIVWRAMRMLGTGRASTLAQLCEGDLSCLTPRHIAQAAQGGDDVAREVWEHTAVYLASGIVNVIFTVDVERVVIGGGVSQVGAALFDPLRRAVAARCTYMPFDVSQIVPAELGPRAGLIGAAQWAREAVVGS